ncbi:MAG: hypothetical protein HZA89_04785 [Verrucomicrobia bacterium]|nr:hypothetical protein [Verrucomicrobiota bacterium]
MEFLKNHYEKIVLGLMLLLMATGAVVLVLEGGSVQERLKEYRQLVIGGDGKPPPQEDLEKLRNILTSAAKPSQADFVKVHRIFNPMAWYVDTNGNLIPGTKVGVSMLAVHSITPQRLLLEFNGIGGTAEKPSLSVKMVQEFGRSPQSKTTKSVVLNATNTPATATSANTLDPVRKLVLLAREAVGPTESPEVKCELHEPGKEPLKFTLSKAQAFSAVVEHIAHIQYMVETNLVWPRARKDTPMTFAGDTNIVVDVTASNVIVRAVSNDKVTTIPLGSAQQAPPAARKQ